MPTEENKYKNVQTGTLNGQPIYSSGVGATPTISSASLTAPTNPLNIQYPKDIPPYPVAGLNSEVTPPLTATAPEQEASSLSTLIRSLNEQNTGQSAFRAEQEKAQGIEELNRTQTDLSSRLKAIQNEALAIPLQLQQDATGRGITAGGLQPIQTAALRNNAIQALGVSTLLETSRGNLTLAQQNVDRAVKQKYDPLLEQITAKTANLKLIKESPEYSIADKNRAQAQLDIQNAKKDAITKAKEDSKTISSWAAAALANGASNYQAQQIMDIAQSDNPNLQEAFKIYSQFAVDPNATAKALAELEQTRAQTALTRAQTAKVNKEARDIGVPQITNPDAGKYAKALGVILGSGKFTKDQKASVIAAVNSGEDPFTVVKNQAKSLLGQTGDTKLTSYEVAKEQLTAVQDTLNKYYAAGGKTSLVSGSYESVINKLGNTNDPNLVQIATEIAASLQIYRNAVSGTAYSVQEGQDIAKIFPGINKSEGLNTAILAGRMRAFDSTIDSTYRSVLGKTYDDLKVSENGSGGSLGQTVQSNGQTYKVGTVYSDKNGNWTVDANGKWTKI